MSEPVHADAHDLASFGYKQELNRSLGSFSSFAAGFSYISILTGMFQTAALGFVFAGRAFIWAWPVVFLGQMTVALQFAELAAHYPLAGSVYQWSKQAGGQAVGLEHGLDLPLRADRDDSRGRARLAGDPAADLDEVPDHQVHGPRRGRPAPTRTARLPRSGVRQERVHPRAPS